MDKVNLALQLILSLSILVVLHEFGHYLPAKWFKTRVEKFYLFFNPYFSLYKKKIGETEWGIGWIPFGGYVKIAGMIDESMDKEQMKLEPQPWEFRSKKAWQRLIIMVGGVTVNFILGILIFAMMMFYWGESYYKTTDVKDGMVVDSLGMQLGFLDGDKVLSVGDIPMEKFNAALVMNEIIINQANNIVVDRGGQQVTLTVPDEFVEYVTKYENRKKTLFYPRQALDLGKVTPDGTAAAAGLPDNPKIIAVGDEPVHFYHEFMKILMDNKGKTMDFSYVEGQDTLHKSILISEQGKIGVEVLSIAVSTQKYGFFESFPKGASMAVNFLSSQLKAFGQMFSGKIKAKDSLGSVFSIASMFDTGWDWRIFWNITASLSILLAFFNLLPIPALDGGYVMFLIWEVITGKAPSDRFMEIVNIIGFVILMGLMLFAIGLDVSRWF